MIAERDSLAQIREMSSLLRYLAGKRSIKKQPPDPGGCFYLKKDYLSASLADFFVAPNDAVFRQHDLPKLVVAATEGGGGDQEIEFPHPVKALAVF